MKENQHSYQSNPISYEIILEVFNKEGYNLKSTINKDDFIIFMNQLYSKHGQRQLNHKVVEQIWDHTAAIHQQVIQINKLVETFLEAQRILLQRIQQLSDENGVMKKVNAQIIQKIQRIRNHPKECAQQKFTIKLLRKQLITLQQEQKQNKTNFETYVEDLYYIQVIFSQNNKIPIPPSLIARKQAIVHYQHSGSLQNLFYLLTIQLFCEFLFLNSLRVSFVPLSTLILGYSIVLIGIRQIKYINACGIGFGISLFGDLMYLIIQISNNVVLMPIRHSNVIFYPILLSIGLFVMISFRLMSILGFVDLKKSQKNTHIKYFTIMGTQYPLLINK